MNPPPDNIPVATPTLGYASPDSRPTDARFAASFRAVAIALLATTAAMSLARMFIRGDYTAAADTARLVAGYEIAARVAEPVSAFLCLLLAAAFLPIARRSIFGRLPAGLLFATLAALCLPVAAYRGDNIATPALATVFSASPYLSAAALAAAAYAIWLQAEPCPTRIRRWICEGSAVVLAVSLSVIPTTVARAVQVIHGDTSLLAFAPLLAAAATIITILAAASCLLSLGKALTLGLFAIAVICRFTSGAIIVWVLNSDGTLDAFPPGQWIRILITPTTLLLIPLLVPALHSGVAAPRPALAVAPD